MSETPITFTTEEQVKLTELDRQVQAFSNFRTLVARSLYIGQDALIVQQLLHFLQEITGQSSKQIEEVKTLASQRQQPSIGK
jgi:hypothetical protein